MEVFHKEMEEGSWKYAVIGAVTTLLLVGVMFLVYNKVVADEDNIPFYNHGGKVYPKNTDRAERFFYLDETPYSRLQ